VSNYKSEIYLFVGKRGFKREFLEYLVSKNHKEWTINRFRTKI